MRSSRHHASSLLCLLLLSSCSTTASAAPAAPPCPWCGASDAPASLGATSRIAPVGEAGVPLDITGTVVSPDGRTPVAGVLIYAYHTNARGIYPRRDDETGRAQEHGSLRGWVRSDAQGRYRFTTIRPAPEAGGTEPAHISLTVAVERRREARIDSIEFDDDTLLTTAVRQQRQNAGGSGIVHPVADARGVQHVVRNIILQGGA